MVDNTTLAYIIGGSVAGGIFIIAIVAIITYCTCGPKRKKKRHEKKFHPLSSDSARQSQHSTLSHIDPRGLPKVGNGLWVEAPAVYQAAPNQGLYYGRPNAKYRVEPGVQRSASELRLPGAPPPPGHAVYQGNVRIYHSQQLAPVYEVVDTSRAPGVISIYEYNDLTHSRSRLINSAERHHPRDRESKKVKRSSSDLRGQHRDRRDNSKRSSSHVQHPHDHRHDRKTHEINNARSSQLKSQSLDSLKASYDNPAFDAHTIPVTSHTAVASSTKVATDSMKLQEKGTRIPYNKTDDEKQIPKPIETEIQTKHYVYEGSVYALPAKAQSKPIQDGDYENPIVARMEAMIIEKTEGQGHSEPQISSSVRDVQSVSASQPRTELAVDPSYSQTRREVAVDPTYNQTRTEAVVDSTYSHTTYSQTRTDVVVDPTYSQVQDVIPVAAPVPTTSHVMEKRELKHPATGERLDSPDGALHPPHPPLSATQSEEFGPTGNRVTSEAFQFLDSYIGSDDEGVDSPPMSPGPHRDAGY